MRVGRSGRAQAAMATLRAVAGRPRLWGEALATLRRMAAPGWWHRPPFLPLPDPAYWRFRMHTAFGEDWSGHPSPDEVLAYLRWCQRVRPARR